MIAVLGIFRASQVGGVVLLPTIKSELAAAMSPVEIVGALSEAVDLGLIKENADGGFTLTARGAAASRKQEN